MYKRQLLYQWKPHNNFIETNKFHQFWTQDNFSQSFWPFWSPLNIMVEIRNTLSGGAYYFDQSKSSIKFHPKVMSNKERVKLFFTLMTFTQIKKINFIWVKTSFHPFEIVFSPIFHSPFRHPISDTRVKHFSLLTSPPISVL